jgi:hypothetical protein
MAEGRADGRARAADVAARQSECERGGDLGEYVGVQEVGERVQIPWMAPFRAERQVLDGLLEQGRTADRSLAWRRWSSRRSTRNW